MFFSVLILIRHLDLSFMHNHSHTHIHIHLSSSCGALPEPPTENVPLTQPFPPQLHQRDVALEWTTVATHRRTSLYNTLHGLRTRLRSAFANICGFRNPRHARCALRGKVASGCGWWSHIWHEVTSWPHDLDNKTNAVIGSNYNKVFHGISTQTRPRHHCKSNTCQYMTPRVSRSRRHHQPFKNHPTFAVQIC